MGVYYILRDVPAGTDGLDPANVLTLMLSPLTGAPIAGQSRMTISARSPLVDGIGDSQGGGFFPAELQVRRLHRDRGQGPRRASPCTCGSRTARPSSGRPRTCGARPPRETTDALREELGDAKIEVAAIGPAGERLALLAADHEHGQPRQRPHRAWAR